MKSESKEKIKIFEGKQVRTVWDEEAGKWWFSIPDIIGILTDQPDYTKARNYWKWFKNKLKDEGSELVRDTNQLKMCTPDGKMRLTDVADTEQISRLIQFIPSPKTESFKMWLARAGYECIAEFSETLLPAVLICKDFIVGMQDCNYEKYLLEIVNTSTYFLKKSHGELYSAPIEESHSECDCCSSAYSLDFKLAASETAMRARNLFSCGSAKLAPGIMMSTTPKIGASNPSYQPIEATRIHAALRSMSLAELKKIKGCNIKCQGIERDIQAFLETMDTQKHILLFFPYEFSYGKEIAFDSAIMEIIRAVNNDFINAIKYRNEVANGFDTYLTFIYAGFFVITIADGDGLLFADAVPTNSSKTFTTLKNN